MSIVTCCAAEREAVDVHERLRRTPRSSWCRRRDRSPPRRDRPRPRPAPARPGHVRRRDHRLDADMAALDQQREIARGRDVGGHHMHVDAEPARRPCRADRGCRGSRRARSRSAANAAPRGLRAPNDGCRRRARARCRHRSTVGVFMCTVAANSSLAVRPAVIGSTTLSTCTPAARSAWSTAWRSISSAAAMSTTLPAFMPCACACPMPSTSIRMGAARQHVLRRARLQPRDRAHDLAGADVERAHDRRAAARDRLHLRGKAVRQIVHASPPFFLVVLP